MDSNILAIEPNMAMFLENHELKFFNLIWGGWQVSQDPSVSFFTNTLLRRGTDGTVIPPSWPTSVEMQTTVDSLDYNGVNFWSIQAINSTPYYPGWVVRRWQTSTKSYSLEMKHFKCFPGFSKGSALTTEYYNFTLMVGIDSSKNYAQFSSPTYDYIMERLLVGQQIRIGPNTHGDYYWGTIRTITKFSGRWEVVFSENFNTSYVAGEDCFTETRLYVFDESGTLTTLNPVNLSVISSTQQDFYKGVTAAGFSVINNVPEINLGNRTRALFFVSGMVVFCKRVEDLGLTIAAKSIPLGYYDDANSFIPIYELRIRNDDPEDINNHPQFYFLQRDYRDSHTSGVSSFPSSTYNYVILKVERENAFMVLNLYPEFVMPSGYIDCRCTLLDDYRFPVSSAPVYWSATPGAGSFITATGVVTNSSGVAYATFSGGQVIPFPAYLTAMTTAM